jgi:predicted histidine transporter YuiF (NhaC family)
MRALCGAIITAGALIGLGLTALGFGVRFQGMNLINENTGSQIGARSMEYLLAILFCGMLVGLGIAFVGLMFHHERRERERHRELGHVTGTGVRP